MVASDRISTYDVVHPTPIPDKGKVLTGLSVLWFDLTRASCPTTSSPPPTACRRSCAAARCACGGWRCCRWSASCAATSPARAGRTTRRTGAVSGIELPDGLQRVRPAARADLHAVDEGRRGPRRGDRLRADASSSIGDRALAERSCATSRSRVYAAVADARARARRDPGRHEVRVRARRRRRAGARRRGLHAGLLALLAGRRYEPGRGQPSFDKQYVRDWAAGTGWDKSPPAPAIPDDVVARRASATSTAYELLAGEPFGAWLERACAVRARVLIRPKAGILDPAGPGGRARAAGARASRASANVHVGRLVELDVEDAVAAAGDVRAAARQPADRGLRDPDRLDEVRRRPLPGLLRRGRRAAGRARASATPSCSGTATPTCAASTRSSSPAASPTATTCASARSRASRR